MIFKPKKHKQRFEHIYKEVTLNKNEKYLSEVLHFYSLEGWELVVFFSMVLDDKVYFDLFFKRPVWAKKKKIILTAAWLNSASSGHSSGAGILLP